MKITKFFGVAAVLLALAAPGVVQSAETTIKFPVEYNADVTPGLANQEFVELIEERSNGEIKVEFFPGGSLYKGLDVLQAVLRGDAHMTTLVSVYWSAISPQLAIFDLPYAFPTHEAFYKATEDQAFMSKAFAEVEAKGGKVIGVLPYDYLLPGNTQRATVMPTDFEGLKLRALGKTNAKTLEALGARAVPINITEVNGALEQGVIDGLNTPADAFVSYKWDETVNHVTYAKYYFAFYPWAVNAEWWDGLPEAHRKLIQETVTEVTVRHRERARQAAADAMEKLKAAGVQLHEQTEEEQDAWMAAVAPIWREAEETHGKPIVDALRSASGTKM